MSTVVEVEGGYEIHMQTGITVEVNNARGTNGVGIENIQYNGEEIVIEMTDETTYGPFQVRGLQGEQGPQGEMGFMGPAGPQGPAGPAGTTDHSLLLNLNADDHTQYLNLNGRAGGQTVRGGTATGENLTLMSTNHATKGSIIFGDSRFNEATNRLNLGAATGTGRINLPDAGTTSADGIFFGNTSLFRSSTNTVTLNGNLVTSTSLLANTITSINGNTLINFNLLHGINLTPNTLTGSSATSALSISQTWNTTGTPSAIDLNITDTASNASSLFVNLRRNGSSVFSISKTGLTSGGVGGLSILYNQGGGSINGGTNGRFSITHSFGLAIYNAYNVANTGITIGANADANARAILDIRSTTKGVLFPNMTTAQRDAIATVAGDAGLTIFNTTTGKLEVWDGTAWQQCF